MGGSTGKPFSTLGMKHGAYRDLIEAAMKQGWTATRTGGGHVRLAPPGGGVPVIAASSPGGGRAEKNLRSWLRSRGVNC